MLTGGIYMINIKDLAKPIASQGFLVGIGVAAFAYFLAPQLKQSLRPAAVKGTQGVLALGGRAKQFLDEGKGKITNLMFEKSEAAKNKVMDIAQEVGMTSKVLKELIEDREVSNKILTELKDSIISLKEEISHMKHGENLQEG